MPAPIGNLNAKRHGGRSTFPLVSLPQGHGFIDRDVSGMRRRLIAAVIARHGELSVSHDSKIGLAVGYEQSRQFIGKSVRDNPKATLGDKIAARTYQDQAAEKRDRAIDSLRLDKQPALPEANHWDAADAAMLAADTAHTHADCTPATNGMVNETTPHNANGEQQRHAE